MDKKTQSTWLAVILSGFVGMIILMVSFCGFAVMYVGGHHWETPERRKEIEQRNIRENEQLRKELSERRK